MRFAHFNTGEVTEHISFHGNLMVFFGCNKVLTFQVQHLEVVLIGLPQVTQVGAQGLFQLFPFQTGVLHCDTCIPEFAATVAVKEIEAYGDAYVQSEVATTAIGGNIIFGIFSAELVIKHTTGLCYTYCKKIITGGILWVQTLL